VLEEEKAELSGNSALKLFFPSWMNSFPNFFLTPARPTNPEARRNRVEG
jgi:hypothetical protein